jgi:sarcosine oxidase
MTSADVIVLGLGGMGTAAAWRLARRGVRVLGLEQFAVGHTQGSSHGHTRIIRQAYYEHPAYVPLVRRAYQGWYELEQATGRTLLIGCPCLSLGPPGGELVAGVRRSAAEHGLPIEDLTLTEVRKRYPAFTFAPDCDHVGVLEHTAGVLRVDDCVRAMAAEARRLGADLQEGQHIIGWHPEGDRVVVETRKGRFDAARLVITAGPWAGRLLGEVAGPLPVMRQVPMWFRGGDPGLFRRDRFPVFISDKAGGYFYGLPALDERGVKVARHYGAAELASPDDIDRTVTDADEAPVRAFLRQHLPAADGPRSDASVCVYTLTPDRHFLIDRNPATAAVVFAAGLSGHGFKFAPAVGEVLADLALDGRTALPADLFRLARLGG